MSQDDLIALGPAAGLSDPGFATCLAEMVEVPWTEYVTLPPPSGASAGRPIAA